MPIRVVVSACSGAVIIVSRVTAPTIQGRAIATIALDGGLLAPEKEKSTELHAEPEQDVALVAVKPLLSLPKDENEAAELGGSVTESLLIRLRFAQRISTPLSLSETSPLPRV